VPERARASFLEFEKWWGGFHFMNEQGSTGSSRICSSATSSRHAANIKPGRPLDLKSIRSPIIVISREMRRLPVSQC
jgi:Protein of unknown function (DUF3141)